MAYIVYSHITAFVVAGIKNHICLDKKNLHVVDRTASQKIRNDRSLQFDDDDDDEDDEDKDL
jgi:hypothetical protein